MINDYKSKWDTDTATCVLPLDYRLRKIFENMQYALKFQFLDLLNVALVRTEQIQQFFDIHI